MLQGLCNPAGKLGYQDQLWERESQLRFSSVGDLMRFCHLVASMSLCPAWTVQCRHEQRGSAVVTVPRDKLAALAAGEVLF